MMQKLQEDWLTAFGILADKASGWDWINVLLICAGFVILALAIIAQFRRGDGFDWRSLVARRTFPDGREFWTVDPGKCYQFGGFLFTSWGFVAFVGKGALSDLYLAVYAAAWLASPAINQIVASKFPVAPGTALPEVASASVTTTTTTEVKS